MSACFAHHVDTTTASTSSAADQPVLVVEDDPKLGRLLVRALGLCGVEADLARSGEVALAKAAGVPYAAVLIDQMLPGMDGLELCRRLRRGGLAVPAVIMSARDDLATQIDPAGADGYLVKPFPLDLLLSTLRSLSLAPRRSHRWHGVPMPAVR